MKEKIEDGLFEQFSATGREIFMRGLISSHAGNMSTRSGNTIRITRRGSMLGRLKEADIVSIDLKRPASSILMASSEIAIHRAVYLKTSALSIIHAHPPYATLLSMVMDELIPVDSEGSYLFQRVPVVVIKKTIGSQEAAEAISEHLKDVKVVLMRGHGSFARGDMLEEAYMFTMALEASAFYAYHLSS